MTMIQKFNNIHIDSMSVQLNFIASFTGSLVHHGGEHLSSFLRLFGRFFLFHVLDFLVEAAILHSQIITLIIELSDIVVFFPNDGG